MAYKVLVGRSAEKDFKKIPQELKKNLVRLIADLSKNPRPARVRKIVNSKNLYRLRAGDYRVVYEIDDRRKTVSIFRIRHRKEVYSNL